jgi:hydroxymethylbilane synthase
LARLHVLQGHCQSPIAGHATTESDGRRTLQAAVFSPDGTTVPDADESGADPTTLGTSVALTLLCNGARELLDTNMF